MRKSRLTFEKLRADDLTAIDLQASQRALASVLPFDDGPQVRALLAAQRIAWAARERGRIVACFGIVETFPGKQGLGWAHLASGIGKAHFELTRFVQHEIAGCGLARLELLTPAPDIEGLLCEITSEFGSSVKPDLLAMAWHYPTPEMRWAVLLGMEPAHLIRQFGDDGLTLMLFERIRAPNAHQKKEAA